MCRYARFSQAWLHITTHHPLCAAIVLTHLPLTSGDFGRKYRPITIGSILVGSILVGSTMDWFNFGAKYKCREAIFVAVGVIESEYSC